MQFNQNDIFVYPRLVLHEKKKDRNAESYWNKLFKNIFSEESKTNPTLVRFKKRLIDKLHPEYSIGKASAFNEEIVEDNKKETNESKILN